MAGGGKRVGHRAIRVQDLSGRAAEGRAGEPGVRGAAVSGRDPGRGERDAARVLRGRDGDDQRAQQRARRRRVELPGLVPACT